jgi:hypothetical protein
VFLLATSPTWVGSLPGRNVSRWVAVPGPLFSLYSIVSSHKILAALCRPHHQSGMISVLDASPPTDREPEREAGS